eukprot:XP_024465758.1 uncharacterized protein LOC112328866 [Populus trichocarpa]
MLGKTEAKKQEIMVASFFIASTAALHGPVMLLQTLSSRSLDHQTKIILMLYKSDPSDYSKWIIIKILQYYFVVQRPLLCLFYLCCGFENQGTFWRQCAPEDPRSEYNFQVTFLFMI